MTSGTYQTMSLTDAQLRHVARTASGVPVSWQAGHGGSLTAHWLLQAGTDSLRAAALLRVHGGHAPAGSSWVHHDQTCSGQVRLVANKASSPAAGMCEAKRRSAGAAP